MLKGFVASFLNQGKRSRYYILKQYNLISSDALISLVIKRIYR